MNETVLRAAAIGFFTLSATVTFRNFQQEDLSFTAPIRTVSADGSLRSEHVNSTLANEGEVISDKTYFVNPEGDNEAEGTTEDTPFRTIQKALDLAQPGDIIQLAPGIYRENVVTRRDGLSDGPITITGPKNAVITGIGRKRVVEINHDNIHLDGFTIDGKEGSGEDSPKFNDKLIYIQGKKPNIGIRGVKITNMIITNAGGECIRLRYFVNYAEIAYNAITNCGIYDFIFNEGGKNGEAIYIGTAPEQLKDGKNPTPDVDKSDNNYIHDNRINTQGNECVDIKEGSSGTIVQFNLCTGQKDPNSGGIDVRGNSAIIRYNEIFANAGVGVRLGGDTDKDGVDNTVSGNIISNNLSGGIKIQRVPQGMICDNVLRENGNGGAVGTYGKQFDPEVGCVQ